MFADAGDDTDLREAFERDSRRKAADQALQQLAGAYEVAVRATSAAVGVRLELWQRAEAEARAALHEFRAALDYAEGSVDEEAAHQAMDAAGRWVRSTFGCLLDQEGTEYTTTCPVKLGHNRIGLSIGGPARRLCGLCGDHLSECEHRLGRAYLVPGGSGDLGWCRVCGEADCGHSADETYRVGVVARVTHLELREVSIVSRPAFPTARFTSAPVDLARLEELLGTDFEPGMPVRCNECLLPCEGLVRHPPRLRWSESDGGEELPAASA